MVLIVGGAYQGQQEYAASAFDGSYKIIDAYHLKVKEQLQNGDNPMELAQKLINQVKADGALDRLVIISDELGYGLVPIDAFERKYREINGRVNCYLASEASIVYRMVCGIPTKIK